MIYDISFNNDGVLNIKRNTNININKNTIKPALETLKQLNNYQYTDESELRKINKLATRLVSKYEKALTDEHLQPAKGSVSLSKTKLPTDFKDLKKLCEDLKQKKILSPEERVAKLKKDALEEGIKVLPFLKKCNISDEAVLDEIASTMSAKSGWSAVCEKLKEFGFRNIPNNPVLVNLAKQLAVVDPAAVSKFIKEFNLQDPALFEVAEELIKNGYADIFCEHIAKFSFNQPSLLKLADLLAVQNPAALAKNIESFHILSADERLRLAQIIAKKEGVVLSQSIKNFHLETTDDVLLKLVENAAENGSWKKVLPFLPNYGIKPDTLQSLAQKLMEKGEVETVIDHIESFGLDPKENELIALEAAKKGIDITEKIKTMGIKDDKVLFQIAMAYGEATSNWTRIAEKIKNFGFNDTPEGYAKKLELAKYIATQPGNLAAFLKSFDLKNSKDRAEILKSLAEKNYLQQRLEVILERVSDLDIQNEKEILKEIAEIVASKNGGLLAKYFKYFAIEKPEDRAHLALLAVETIGGEAVATYLQDFQIQDPETLKELAAVVAKKNGKLLAENIAKFNIKEDSELLLLAVKQAGWNNVGPLVQNFAITDVKERIRLAKLAAQASSRYFASFVSQFGFQAKLSTGKSKYENKKVWLDTLNAIEAALEKKNTNQFFPSTPEKISFFMNKEGKITILSEEASNYWNDLLEKKYVSVDDLEKRSDQLETMAQVFRKYSLVDKNVLEKASPDQRPLLISSFFKAAEYIQSLVQVEERGHLIKGQEKVHLPIVVKGRSIYIYSPAQVELLDYFTKKKWPLNDTLMANYVQMDRILNGFIKNGVGGNKIDEILGNLNLPVSFQSILQLGEELSKLAPNQNLSVEILASVLTAVHHLEPDKVKNLSLLSKPERRDHIFNTLKAVGEQIAEPTKTKVVQKGTDQQLSFIITKGDKEIRVEIGQKEQTARAEKLVGAMKAVHLIGEMPSEKAQKLTETFKSIAATQEQLEHLAQLEEKAGKEIILNTLMKIAKQRKGGVKKTVKASKTKENLAYKIMTDGRIQIEDEIFSAKIADALFKSPMPVLNHPVLEANMRAVLQPEQIKKLSLFGLQSRRELILNTFLEIGEQVKRQKQQFESTQLLHEGNEKRRTFLINEGEVFIKEDGLSRGSFKVVSEGVGLSSTKPVIFAFIDGSERDITDALRESDVLKELHNAKIPNLSPAYLVKVLTVDGIIKQQRLVLIQEKVGRAEKILEDMKAGKIPYNLNTILKLAWGGAKGLAGMHKQGFVHSDFKPPNLLFDLTTEEGLVHDFGLTVSTKEGIRGGTLNYAPPKWDGAGLAKPSFDSFSLGVSLFEMLTGQEGIGTKSFSAASNQNEIDQFIEQEKNKKILPPAEKAKFDQAMDLCKQLIKLDSFSRLSCADAAQKLEQLVV